MAVPEEGFHTEQDFNRQGVAKARPLLIPMAAQGNWDADIQLEYLASMV